jgi:hypothetical protein
MNQQVYYAQNDQCGVRKRDNQVTQGYYSIQKPFLISKFIHCVYSFTVPLPSNKRRKTNTLPSLSLEMMGGYTYRHTDRWNRLMNYTTETGSGTMPYIPSFENNGSSIQELVCGEGGES